MAILPGWVRFGGISADDTAEQAATSSLGGNGALLVHHGSAAGTNQGPHYFGWVRGTDAAGVITGRWRSVFLYTGDAGIEFGFMIMKETALDSGGDDAFFVIFESGSATAYLYRGTPGQMILATATLVKSWTLPVTLAASNRYAAEITWQTIPRSEQILWTLKFAGPIAAGDMDDETPAEIYAALAQVGDIATYNALVAAADVVTSGEGIFSQQAGNWDFDVYFDWTEMDA